jgi:hypothetical protein
MKISRLFTALLALILLACLSGVQGQYTTSSTGSAAQSTPEYSQFYTMPTGPAPSAHISAPQQFEIAGSTPSTIYFSNQMQSVPYSQYQSNPTYAGTNSLWIKGAQDWSQYATVPMGAIVSLLAISPTGGSGTLNFVDADGQTYSYNYFFYPNSLFTFYADKPGRHMISFVINGKASNQVIIDVTGTYTPNNYLPPSYYPYYGYGFDNGFSGPGNFNDVGSGQTVGEGSRGSDRGSSGSGDKGSSGSGDQGSSGSGDKVSSGSGDKGSSGSGDKGSSGSGDKKDG